MDASSIAVPSFGLGLAALGRPGYINLGHAADLGHSYDVAAMRAHAEAVLDAAWQGGIRYYDVARSYGRAEEFISSWLASRQIEASTICIGSKWGYVYTANWKVDAPVHEVKDHTLTVLRRQWSESRALLGSHLKLYQIHSATVESGVLRDAAVLTELSRLKAEGVSIGLTLSGPAQAKTLLQALEVEVEGVALFQAVQATWNVLEPSAGPALQQARAAGLTVLLKEVLANGRLTNRHPDPHCAPQQQVLRQHAERLGTTVDALAIAIALAQPFASIVLSGAATIGQLASNLKAGEVRLDEAAIVALAGLAEAPAMYWQTRSQLVWN